MRSFCSWPTLAVVFFTVFTHGASIQADAAEGVETDRYVFAHFMMGIMANRQSSAEYDTDMQLAKATGIDAFALNIGTDSYTETQLNYAYESAAENGMQVFISFDFNWYSPTADAAKVGSLIKTYAERPAQLMVDNKAFVSTYNGDGLDVAAVKSAAGIDMFIAPNFHPDQTTDVRAVDGAFNWMGWDNDGNNRAPSASSNVTVAQSDETYTNWLGSKAYIAPVSPWFSTHYGPEVSYSKNWVFPGDLLWYNRWVEILKLGPRFLEIITWNDYGESHYIGPLATNHTDDGASKWVNDMPHNGFRDLAKPFIAAYKAGATDPTSYVTEDKIVYWYRPTMKGLNCDATDNIGARPDGYDTMQDAVFVVALLKKAGKVTATSGAKSKTFDAPAGVSAWQLDMGVGPQMFSLERNGTQVLNDTSLRDITDACPCGLYNYNVFVGTVPAGTPDALSGDGFAGFSSGLKVACAATPSLPIRVVAASHTPA